MNRSSKQYGVTLIELMIVVAIISIIAAVAYPAYQNQAEKTRRAEGTSALTRIMDMQERFYANNFPPAYTVALALDLGFDSDTYITEGGHYSITAAPCPEETIDTCVLLTAAVGADKGASGAQVEDGVLTLNSLGASTRDGAAGWD